MGRLVLRGVGLAIGLALWPLALPVAVVMGLGLAIKAAAKPQGGCADPELPPPGCPPPGGPLPTPELDAAKARAMAVVAEVNREHLERSLND